MKKSFNFILLVFSIFFYKTSFGFCEKILAVSDVKYTSCGEVKFKYIIEKGTSIKFEWIIDNSTLMGKNDFTLKFSGKRFIPYTVHIWNDCSDFKITDSVYIDYEPISVMAAYELQNCTEAKFHFKSSNENIMPKTIEWTGDGGLMNLNNEWEPTHIYPGPGIYYYTLKYKADGACEYSYFNGKVVIKNTASAQADDDKTICMYNGQQILTGMPIGGIWTGNGVDGNIFDPEKAGVGTHELLYTTKVNTCEATDKMMIVVKDINPDFTSDVIEGTAPLTVNFSANNIINNQNVNWDFGDAKSQSLNTSVLPNTSHTYTQHGEYNVTLNMNDDETGCSGQKVYKKMIRVSEINTPGTRVFSQGLVIYPNPTKGVFKFVVEKPENVNYTIDIISINGQLLCSSGIISLPSTEINLSNIASGLYLVKVNMDSGKTLTGKLVLLN